MGTKEQVRDLISLDMGGFAVKVENLAEAAFGDSVLATFDEREAALSFIVVDKAQWTDAEHLLWKALKSFVDTRIEVNLVELAKAARDLGVINRLVEVIRELHA